jgi:hypothetical protein
MKVLIQNPENSLYLEGLNRWSHNVSDAFDFGNSDHAIQFCASHGIAPVHVVLQWSGIPYSITIPIAAANQGGGEEKGRARKHA